MTRAVFDCYWDARQTSGDIERRVALGDTPCEIVYPRPAVDALILFPALLTPCLASPDTRWLSLLLVVPWEKQLTAEDVNEQLKFTRGLCHFKVPDSSTLLDVVAAGSRGCTLDDVVRVVAIEHALTPGKVIEIPPHPSEASSGPTFAGILNGDNFVQHLGEFRSGRLFVVHVAAFVLEHANAAPRSTVTVMRDVVDQWIVDHFKHLRAAPDVSPNDLLSAAAKLVADRVRPKAAVSSFRVDGRDILTEEPDEEHPIVAHHPIVQMDCSLDGITKIGHLSDLHINSRQRFLRSSAAAMAANVQIDTRTNDQIGPKVHVYAQSVVETCGELASRGAQAIIFGGDFIDHIRNAAPLGGADLGGGGRQLKLPKEVWKKVQLTTNSHRGDGTEPDVAYKRYPDVVAAYSLLRWLTETKHLPVFGVTGNHDAYRDAYAISPRILEATWNKKANEGIAADHNLTQSEAILAFGQTYGTWISGLNFTSSEFSWYCMLLSPFMDWRYRGKRTHVIGLSWGESETFLTAANLPTAAGALFDEQWQLLSENQASNAAVLVATHFTLASYHSIHSERESQTTTAVIESAKFAKDGDYSDGTFEKKRPGFYAMVTAGARVLTGHSHRRAAYSLTQGAVSRDGSHSDVKMLPTTDAHLAQVIVSASAGPYPRRNVLGEFLGWGSEKPGGTLLSVSEGEVTQVDFVTAKSAAAPRMAVVMDYLFREKKSVFDLSGSLVLPGGTIPDSMTSNGIQGSLPAAEGRIATRDFAGPVTSFLAFTRHLATPVRWDLRILLHQHLRDLGITLARVALRRRDDSPDVHGPGRWDELVLNANPSVAGSPVETIFELDSSESATLQKLLGAGTAQDLFAGLVFAPPVECGHQEPWDAYDWSDPWWIRLSLTPLYAPSEVEGQVEVVASTGVPEDERPSWVWLSATDPQAYSSE